MQTISRLSDGSGLKLTTAKYFTAADEEMSRREFGAGRAVFLRNWPYALSLFEAEGSPVRGRVGIAPLPGGGALGGAHLGINRRTPHPDLAWALVEYLVQRTFRVERGMTVLFHAAGM